MAETTNFKEAFDAAKKSDGKIDEQETADLVKKLANSPDTKDFVREISTKISLEKGKVISSTRQAWKSLDIEVRTSIQELIGANKDGKIGKDTITKLKATLQAAPANAAPANAAPANAAPAAPESTETSKVTYKLKSEDVIKTAIANLDHNSVSINQEQIIGSYVDSEGKDQKIVLKGSSTNLRVELDGTGTLDDTDLPVEKSDFESIKKAVTTLIDQYKKEILTKKGDKAQDKKGDKAPDKKGDKAPDKVNENEKKVGSFTKLDGKSANIMLFRYANQNNGDSINDKPYRFTVELDKSDKFIDPSIDFDHEPTEAELKTAITKLTSEYETYKTQEKQKEAKIKESEAKSKLEKENQSKIDTIKSQLEGLKLSAKEIKPDGLDENKWVEWIKGFGNDIEIDVTEIDLKSEKINFEFDNNGPNSLFNSKISISGAIKEGKLDVTAFKKALPEQVGNAIKSMVKQSNTEKQK